MAAPDQKIVPNLWFDKEAEPAAEFYTTLFKNSALKTTAHYSEAGQEIHGQEAGQVMTVEFSLRGYDFVALNAGPQFKFNPSISFFASCETKDETQRLWDGLAEDGSALMEIGEYPFSDLYGWVADRYGVSWQVSYNNEEPGSIFPALLFVGEQVGRAEEAIRYYASLFPDSEVGELFRYPEGAGKDQPDTIAFGPFTLAGQDFSAMDSAETHDFQFNEAVSFIVNCSDQQEVDYYWEKLSAVPESEACGWVKDQFGVSWQIVPTVLNDLMTDGDRGRADRVMEKMLRMKKLDIAELEAAAAG